MPRALDPNGRIEIYLDSDADQSPRPTFYFRPPTMRDEGEIANLYDKAVAAPEPDSLQTGLCELLAPRMVAWENMGRPFDPKAVSDLLCTAEAMEIARKLMASGRLSDDEKKSSESPEQSAGELSASTAPPEPAKTP